MTTAVPPARRFPLGLAGTTVEEYLRPLQQGYLTDRSEAVARLAQLRRGAGKTPEEVPELWALTGTELLYQDGPLPEEEATRAESAVHIAVTLYALHQQSHHDKMHQPGPELGEAVRQLMRGGEIDEPVRKRFVRAGAATTSNVLAYRLREITTLLRRDAIPLDYGKLADRLYQAQRPGGMLKVRQAWGRSFHAYQPKKDDTPTDKDAS
ncbi:type I-E CRISPR-associated protein Cse2/CasB [Streptomyces gobiensis]|uniref:type I-E CRISPR-associated protein Cse2/CasB n=1 Tax=Streptomyces gobiensis TaxID=2875706 RepID=UPI001E501E85|nr:type I-E CRISPR-associated protein Cse2/CasB [Streptomyces gobiensis]UGY93720.1 type I-E CRISPR-associated protein Cse2/CasB [Streptomyces gobiensis]